MDQSLVHQIGEDLTKCPLNCEGIAKDWEKGIWPRCLYHEPCGDEAKGVVGVPHPTGSFGDFHRLHSASGELRSKFAERAQHCWQDGNKEALWLKAG